MPTNYPKSPVSPLMLPFWADVPKMASDASQGLCAADFGIPAVVAPPESGSAAASVAGSAEQAVVPSKGAKKAGSAAAKPPKGKRTPRKAGNAAKTSTRKANHPKQPKPKDAPLPKRRRDRPTKLYARYVIISATGVYSDWLVASNKADYTLTPSTAGIAAEYYIPI